MEFLEEFWVCFEGFLGWWLRGQSGKTELFEKWFISMQSIELGELVLVHGEW